MNRCLEQLSLWSLRDEHIFWLAKMCQSSYFGESAKGVLERARRGECQVWGFNGDKGVVLTEFLQHPGGKELFVCGFAGNGVIAKLRTIQKELAEVANALYRVGFRKSASQNETIQHCLL